MSSDIGLQGHSVIIDDRKTVDITGVTEVCGFDDETVNLNSSAGKITIKGENLKISNFNNENGNFKAEGKIHGVIYINSGGEKHGFISRLLK